MSDAEKLGTAAEKRPSRTVSFTLPNIRMPRSSLQLPQRRLRGAVVVVLFLLAIGLSGFTGAWLEARNNSNPFSADLSSQKKIVSSESQLISQIAQTVGPSVVSVNVAITTNSGASTTDPFGLFGFSSPQAQQQQAAGTGIIVSNDGVIVTNRHVVPKGTTNVRVTLSDGTELKNVSVIGRTSDSDSLDVAFLKINDTSGHKLTPAVIGDSATVQVGDDSVAIGNALGQFRNTVTKGIISGYGRSVQATDSSGSAASAENLDDLFQTDAAINEGNSGGPLVNLNGQVIGINTAIAGNAQNIGFAIPINDVRGLITQVLKTGKFQRPYLGVRYIPLTAAVANQYGLSVTNGAFITPSNDPANSSVVAGGPADQAGLKERDIITAVNGAKIDQTHSLTSLLNPHLPSDSVNLTILRGSTSKQVSVTLGSLPNAQ